MLILFYIIALIAVMFSNATFIVWIFIGSPSTTDDIWLFRLSLIAAIIGSCFFVYQSIFTGELNLSKADVELSQQDNIERYCIISCDDSESKEVPYCDSASERINLIDFYTHGKLSYSLTSNKNCSIEYLERKTVQVELEK